MELEQAILNYAILLKELELEMISTPWGYFCGYYDEVIRNIQFRNAGHPITSVEMFEKVLANEIIMCYTGYMDEFMDVLLLSDKAAPEYKAAIITIQTALSDKTYRSTHPELVRKWSIEMLENELAEYRERLKEYL